MDEVEVVVLNKDDLALVSGLKLVEVGDA